MAENDDSRFDHIKTITIELLNATDGHWAELIWKEENQAIIKDFLDSPTSIILLSFLDQDEKLSLSTNISSVRYIPKVLAYFMKSCPIVSSENCKREIMFGSISDEPLRDFQNLFEKVLHPIFSNRLNNRRWPADIANDIILHFEDFRKKLSYHVGLAQGKTMLVIPEMAKMIENFDIDNISRGEIDWNLKNVINAITDMLCDWIPIIREVLEVTSESILLKVQQGPDTEIEFWENRKLNLEFIQKQLSDPLIEKMVFTLEKVDNAHYPLFKGLLQDVVEALAEANEISESLSSMSEHLEKLKTCSFYELKEELPEAMKAITLSWTNSKYFSRVPSRISILIKKSCFFLIEKVEDYLNPSEIFRANESEMKNKVKLCIETCNVFLQYYSDCRENFAQDTKVYPWEFPDQRVFDSFGNFLKRLNIIDEIFEASAVYCSLSDYKILGIQQVPFKMRLDELSATFKEYYQIFIECTYNPLDLKSDIFIEDYNLFSLRLDELDYKLGTTLSQACMSCVTSEDSFQLMYLVQDLLNRPVVNLEFKKFITSLLRNLHMELLAAKECYDNVLQLLESNDLIIYKNLPDISGKLQWSIDLQRKLSCTYDSQQQMQHYYINAEDADLFLKTYQEIEELLQKFQSEIVDKWKLAVDIVRKQLNKTLFEHYESYLLLNFDPQVLEIAQEIEYIKLIKKSDLLPSDAVAKHDTLKKISLAHSLLACTTRWYNGLIHNLMNIEKMLIKDEWENLSENLKKGLEEKWERNDLEEYAKNVYLTAKSLYERINKAKKNVEEIQTFIETWNKSPVFSRETPDSLVEFKMIPTPEMVQQKYNVIQTSIKMNQVMEENMSLFKPDPQSDEWKNYVSYLDTLIETGLKESIQCSLQYIAENTNGWNKKLVPFCKIKMILKEDIEFVPSLDLTQQGNFFELFETLIDTIYSSASEIKCIAETDMDYLATVLEDDDLKSLKKQVFQQVESGINRTLAQSENYRIYSDIWLQDIDAVLEDFTLYGPITDTKLQEGVPETAVPSLELKPPTEDEFKNEIVQFDLLQKKIEDIPSEILTESWLLLDTVLFKESLSLLIKNWSSAYKKRLIELKNQGKLLKVEEDRD